MFRQINDFPLDRMIIGGDFNAVLDNDMDKLHGLLHKNKLAREEIINHMKLLKLVDVYRELHPNVRKYTRYQTNPVIASRLDFFLMSQNLLNQVKGCDIIPSIRSDHKVVTVDIDITFSPRGKGYWKFNNDLLADNEFVDKIKSTISDFLLNNTADETNPHVRWEALKCFLRGHIISYSAEKKKRMFAKQTILENLIKQEEQKLLSSSDESVVMNKIKSFQNDLDSLVQNRTKGAIIRSRCRWAENGEQNTKYFLNLEKRNATKKKYSKT